MQSDSSSKQRAGRRRGPCSPSWAVRRKVLCVTAALCVAAAACVSVYSENPADRQEAERAAARGEWVRAGQSWLRVHEAHRGQDEQAALGVARALYEQGQFAGAASFLSPLLARHPERAELWAFDADIQSGLGDRARARRSLEVALELDPGRSEWARQLGELQLELGDPRAALASFGLALLTTDEDGASWIGLARSSEQCGDALGALRAYGSAFRIREGEFDELLGAVELGLAELEFDRERESPRLAWLVEPLLDWSERACDARPQSARASLLAGRVARLAGRTEPAQEHFERAAQLDPASLPALIALIEVRVARGDASGAQRIATHALGLELTEEESARVRRALE